MIYKEKNKAFHDRMVSMKEFHVRQKILLFHSCLKLYLSKLCSRWIRLIVVANIFNHGAL